MSCPVCGAIDVGSAGTCLSCSSALVRRCQGCGTESPASSLFCSLCGTRLDGALLAPAQREVHVERRVVSVLFADIMGSLRAISGMDPEEVADAFAEIMAAMANAVEGHGGFVSKQLGDGMMAIFGHRATAELHAVQACLAAIAIRDSVHGRRMGGRWNLALQVRLGINSGDVVVTTTGRGPAAAYDAIGPVVHVASRMEQAAPAGSIYVASATIAAVAGYVELTDIIDTTIKGLDAPLQVAEVLRAVRRPSRLRSQAAKGLTEFVNRTHELDTLRRARLAAARGSGSVLVLSGEAGCGKSRLIYEFTRDLEVGDWRLFEASALAFGRAGYRTITTMIRDVLDLGAGHGAEDTSERLSQSFDLSVPAVQALTALCNPGLKDPAWTSLDPFQRRLRIADAVCAILVSEAEKRPVVFLVEDLHWIDAESLSVIDQVARLVEHKRILLLVTCRPYYEPPWAELPWCSNLPVSPLDGDAATRFLEKFVLPGPDVDRFQQMVIARTGGNPFFIEQSIAALAEANGLRRNGQHWELLGLPADHRLPSSVRVLLAARLDRLPEDRRRLVEGCAVLDHGIDAVLLGLLLDQATHDVAAGLAGLVEEGFLVSGDDEYSFQHALIRETTYQAILVSRRRVLHNKVVEVLETNQHSRRDDLEMLAEHARLGASWQKAAKYARMSARKAVNGDFNAEAVRLLDDALRAVAEWEDGPAKLAMCVDLHLEQRFPTFKLGLIGKTAEHLAAASRLVDALGDPARLTLLHTYQSHLAWLRGEPHLAMASIEAALRVSDAAGDTALHARARFQKGLNHLTTGAQQASIEEFKSVLECEPAVETHGARVDRSQTVTTHYYLTRAHLELGDAETAAETAAIALQLAQGVDKPISWLFASMAQGVFALSAGRGQAAIGWFVKARDISQDASLQLLTPIVTGFLGMAYLSSGQVELGTASLAAAVTDADKIGLVSGQPSRLAALGRAHLQAGDRDAATACAARALSMAELHGEVSGRLEAASVLKDAEFDPVAVQS